MPDTRTKATGAEVRREVWVAETADGLPKVAFTVPRAGYQLIRYVPADSARGWEERLRALEIRRSEMRMLLARLVRYVRRDTHPIALRDFSEKVADYLDRTHEPADILRELPPPPTSDK